MPRLTLAQCCLSRLPEVIGACSADTPRIASAVNAAQERLVFAREAGDEGWYGSFAEMAFNVLQSDPYLALNRYCGRLMSVDVCDSPVNVNNQFYEYLRFGDGRQPRGCCTPRFSSLCDDSALYARGVFPTFRDLTPGHLVRVRATDPVDVSGDKRVLIQGTDTTDTIVTSLDITLTVQGIYVIVTAPFADTPFAFNTLTGIQKDVTSGPVQFWDVDPATANETLILTMEGGETVAGYPRYYLDKLPISCCPVVTVNGAPTVQVRVLVKLNLIPVVYPTDYLLIQCLEAIIAECQSARYATMDIPNAKQMSRLAHQDAIRFLNGELTHYYGLQSPAISVKPFGSARLERQCIGTLI